MAAIPSLLALLAVAVMLRAANFGPRRLFPCRFSTKPQNKATSEWPLPKAASRRPALQSRDLREIPATDIDVFFSQGDEP
jgi:hypothetical protein